MPSSSQVGVWSGASSVWGAHPAQVGGRIVLADDDPVMRRLVAVQLRRNGATVIEVADGAEALAACGDPAVELAILDVQMPELSGFDVLEALKRSPVTASLAVLLLTGHSLGGGLAKALGLGAIDYIRKPFELDELQARVDAAVLLHRRTRELADSETAFRGLFDGAHAAMSILDLDGRVRRVNHAWEVLLDRPAALAAGLDSSSLVHPEDGEHMRAAFAEMRAGRRDEHCGRLRVLRPDGAIRWADVSTTLVRDDCGQPTHLHRILIDVTEAVLAHQALAESENRYATVLDHLPGNAVLVLDRNLRIITAGGAALNGASGHSTTASEGRLIRELLAPADYRLLLPKYRAALAGKASGSFEYPASTGMTYLVDAVPLSQDETGVSQILVAIRDITVLKRTEQALEASRTQLERLAEHDPLTGLLNRRGFQVRLDEQLALVQRYGPTGALLVLDLDHFKQVNDTLGHTSGDELLVAMAEVLRRTIRKTDVVARLGGDEFAVILPHADRFGAERVAAKIVQAIREQGQVRSGEHGLGVTTSVGVALFDQQSSDGLALMVHADTAMYDAKNAGRDRYALHLSEPTAA